ncbi:MAG: hypothetical protein HKN49_08880 [Gammaproteobacteria bacterium]|nr:hypothetical protein [Gammaproteobacteria bacterium]
MRLSARSQRLLSLVALLLALLSALLGGWGYVNDSAAVLLAAPLPLLIVLAFVFGLSQPDADD